MTTSLPSPIAIPLSEYENETRPFVKLHRLVDTYEALIKYLAVLSIQSFYAAGLAPTFVEVDELIRKDIARPSLGHWVGFLRETLKCFGQQPDKLFHPNLFLFYFRQFGSTPKPQAYINNGAVTRLQKLRNELAHGATLPDNEAKDLLKEHQKDLQILLAKVQFLADWSLFCPVGMQTDSGEYYVQPLMGPDLPGVPLQTRSIPHLSSDKMGHILVQHPQLDVWLDLHPLIVFTECEQIVEKQRCGQRKILFFNDLKDEKRIAFLDYWRGHHSRFQSPNPLTGEFGARFPKVQYSTQKAQRFDEFVYRHTENFVGRQVELKRLDQFIATSSKQVLVIFGAPGMGKSSLLAKWTEEHQAIRHFIREGDVDTYDPKRIFENLSLQLSEKFSVGLKRPAQSEVDKHRQVLEQILVEIATNTPQPILIVLDGLDEALRSSTRGYDIKTTTKTIIDWLPEPGHLPSNIRLILSSRFELQKNPTFSAKFDRDKAEWLELSSLADAEIRALLYQVRSKYEVLATPKYIDAIVERSAGSPLYVRMLIEDLVEGRMIFGQIDTLPQGVIAYFERILKFIEDEGRTRDLPNVETELRIKQDTYTTLITQGLLTPEQAGVLLEKDRVALGDRAGIKSVELLALYSLAKEPLTLAEAATILQVDSADAQQAFENIRTVLNDHSEGRFAIFHASFRDYFLNLDQYVDTKLHRYAGAIAQVQDRLLDYCARWQDHNSSYVLRHYAAHLADAGSWKVLHDLVAYGQDHQPWAKKQFDVNGSYRNYLADLDLARSWVESDQGWDMGNLIHYALIESSIHSQARNVPPKLLGELVKIGYWNADRALASVWEIPPDGFQRSEAITELIPYLSQSQLLEALAIAKSITNAWARAKALAIIAPHLSADDLTKILEIVKGISPESAKATALSKVAEHLSEDLGMEALTIARTIVDKPTRASTLIKLANLLPNKLKQQVQREALILLRTNPDVPGIEFDLIALVKTLPGNRKIEVLKITRQIEGLETRIRVLSELVQHMPSKLRTEVLEEALTTVRQVANSGSRGVALSELVNYFPEPSKTEAMREALEAARVTAMTTGNFRDCLQILDKLAPHLSPDLQVEAIKMARKVMIAPIQVEALNKLATHVPADQKTQIIREALSIVKQLDGELRVRALNTLSANLPSELRIEALQIARETIDERWRISVISELLPHLDEDLKSEAIQEALATIQIDDHWEQAEVLTRLAQLLPNELRLEILISVLEKSRKIQDKWLKASVLTKLSEYLYDELNVDEWLLCFALQGLHRCLPKNKYEEIKLEVEWGSVNKKATLALVSTDNLKFSLSHRIEKIVEFLNAISDSDDDEIKALAINGLAPFLPNELKDQALNIAGKLSEEDRRSVAIAGLISYLPDKLKTDAITMIQEVKDQQAAILAFSNVLNHLPPDLRLEIVTKVLRLLPEIGDESTRALCLVNITYYLPEGLKLYALEIALGITKEEYRAFALAEMAAHLPANLQAKALLAVRSLTEEQVRIHGLGQISKYLPTSLQAEVLVSLRSAQHQWLRAETLGVIVSCLPDELKPAALIIARETKTDQARVEALSRQIEFLPEEMKSTLMNEIFTSLEQMSPIGVVPTRVDTLIRLSDHVPDADKANLLLDALQGVTEIQNMADGSYRRAWRFERISSRWEKIDFKTNVEWKPIYSEILRSLMRHRRSELLRDLEALAPFISHFGGASVVYQTCSSIGKVGHWWP